MFEPYLERLKVHFSPIAIDVKKTLTCVFSSMRTTYIQAERCYFFMLSHACMCVL